LAYLGHTGFDPSEIDRSPTLDGGKPYHQKEDIQPRIGRGAFDLVLVKNLRVADFGTLLPSYTVAEFDEGIALFHQGLSGKRIAELIGASHSYSPTAVEC
jgi:hypothetical protein